MNALKMKTIFLVFSTERENFEVQNRFNQIFTKNFRQKRDKPFLVFLGVQVSVGFIFKRKKKLRVVTEK